MLDAVVPAGTGFLNAASTPALVTFGQDDTGRAASPGYNAVTGVGTPAAAYFASWRPPHAR